MKYRAFGKTGLQVSSLGFGLMRLPIIGQDMSQIDEEKAMEMVRLAVDNGVNYFDTAYPYHTTDFSKGGSSEPFLAKALRSMDREKVFLATKLPSWLIQSRSDMDRYLDEQLTRLDTDYLDFYLLHGLNKHLWGNMVKHDAFEFLGSAVKEGKIHYAGFSFHDDLPLFKEIVEAYDWTFCQIQYNYFDEHFQAGREGLEFAAQKDMAVVAMEPLRGGSLTDRLPVEAQQIFKEADPGKSAAEWALQWVWNHPEVSIVLSGMSCLDHVKENLTLAERISDAPLTEKDKETIEKAREIIVELQKVNCTSCGYCMPCPEGVNIPRNFEFYNDHYLFHNPSAKLGYQMILGETEKASNCAQCGLCEEQCPQHILIREELEGVADLFKS
jgi:predicted aldo/keto reductase-like oxidoreductase